MNTEQKATLRRLIESLDQRYTQMNGKTSAAIDLLQNLSSTLEVNDPLTHKIADVLFLLVQSADYGAELQWEVADVLKRQVAKSRSAKKAYDLGWEARLMDLLARATPLQVVTIHEVLMDAINFDEDEVPF